MLDRTAATQTVLDLLPDEALLVTGLGNIAFEVFHLKDRLRTFYTWGAMGTAVSVGLGLALARPEERVVVLEGDGSLLMNLSALTTIGRYQPRNLVLCVWDNEQFQITGGQATATSAGVDLAAVAAGCALPHAARADTADDLRSLVRQALAEPGPRLLAAKVSPEITRGKLPRKPVLLKYRFMRALGTVEGAEGFAW